MHTRRISMRTTRTVAALALPLLACVLQWTIREVVHPASWILFYPTAFLSLWLGGLRVGLLATAASVVLVRWFLVPPDQDITDVRFLVPAAVFMATGAVFAAFYDRAKAANRRLAATVEERQLSDARSSGILSISADAIISIDEQHRITMFNEGAELIFGFSKAEAIGASLDILIPERFRAIHREHVERFAAGSLAARRMEERRRPIFGLRKNGTEFPADASISKLEVGGKRILTVTIRDITAPRRIEAEQRFLAEVGTVLAATLDYEETLRNIAELAVRDLCDYCIVDVVSEAGEVHRISVACHDPANADIADRLARVRIESARSYLTASVLRGGRGVLLQPMTDAVLTTFAQSKEHLSILQALRARSVIITPLVARGELLGAIALVSSTPAREYHEADVALADELARRAALSIENARLYAKARMAIQSRDDVLGIVAHDLRNPLGVVTLHASVLQCRASAEQQRHIQGIQRAAVRMEHLIRDLLDVARIESGRLCIEKGRLAAAALLAESVEAQRSLAAAAEIDLQLEEPPELPDLWADRDRISQIFENLIGNAVKFTGRGGSIRVGAAPRVDEILFWVTDTGAGIAPEHQPHVFERFWQPREARRHGAGLGLTIVKGLVEAHGGRVWFESTRGQGTTFFFTIPSLPAGESWRQLEAHTA